MSVTIYIEGWDKQESVAVREYMDQVYPNLTPDDFPPDAYPRDENGRVYQETVRYVNPFPEMQMCNANWYDLSVALSVPAEAAGSFDPDFLPLLMRRCVKLLNSKKLISNAVRPYHYTRNFHFMGTSEEYISLQTSRLMELIHFAIERNKTIYWL